jgi:hypothetical protein
LLWQLPTCALVLDEIMDASCSATAARRYLVNLIALGMSARTNPLNTGFYEHRDERHVTR